MQSWPLQAQPLPPAAAASAAAAPASAEAKPAERPFTWDYSWQDWHGISFFVSQKTRISESVSFLPILDFQEMRFAGSIGGRIEVDGSTVQTSGTIDGLAPSLSLRRARITASGASILAVPFRYRVDLGYEPNRFTVTKAYVTVPGTRYLGDVTVGQFNPPVGMQMIASSWDIPLTEPAAPLQAIAPSAQPGIQSSGDYLNQRGTWALGLYAAHTTDGDYGSGAKSFGTFVGRVTWLAIDAPEHAKRYLHLGLSTSLQYGGNGQLRYRSRPEVYESDYVIDTGTINASKVGTFGAEVLWINGPMSIQGEWIQSRVDGDKVGSVDFYGLYVMADWMLTGESRPYKRDDGAPGRIVPARNFAFGPNGGWGALQLATRLSYTDLTDAPVRGGQLTMLTGALTWTLRPQLKWMFELGTGRVRDGRVDGNLTLAQIRMGVYFY